MRARLKTPLLRLLLAGVAATVPVSSALADEQDFKATIVFRVTSLQQVGDQLFIDAAGRGHSRLLGAFTAIGSVVQTLVPGDCDPASGDLTFESAAGTLQIHDEALVCFNEIIGAWEVTGGSGAFLGASGGGTDQGHPSLTGQDPVVIRFEGAVSIEP